MFIMMPYSLYEGETKVTPKEYRLYVILNKLCAYEFGIGKNRTLFTSIDLLEQWLNFDPKNDRRSRKIVFDSLIGLKEKKYINFEWFKDESNKKEHYRMIKVTFNDMGIFHQFDSSIFHWTEDEFELMILGYIDKWSGAKYDYRITYKEYSVVLGHHPDSHAAETKIKRMVNKGMISNEKGKWNIEKHRWKPNKQKINKDYDPNNSEKNELENPTTETRKHRFYSDWKDEPLRVDDFEILLTSTDEKWVEKVRRKLENIANKNSTMAEMFQRLETAAIDEIEKSKQRQSLYDAQLKRIEHEHTMYGNGLKDKLDEIRRQEQEERESRPDLTMLWDENDEIVVDDENEEFYKWMSNS